jgi:hypothetical protein
MVSDSVSAPFPSEDYGFSTSMNISSTLPDVILEMGGYLQKTQDCRPVSVIEQGAAYAKEWHAL